MGDAFQRILNGVGEVVHRVDAPLVTLTVVMQMTDPVNNRITHIKITGGQIDLCSERVAVVLKLAVSHTCKQIQTLFDRAVTVRRNSRSSQIATVFLELLGGQFANVCQSLFDEGYSKIIGFLEIVGTVEETVAPIEAQPMDVFLDCFNEFHILFGGIGVIHAKIAQAVILFGSAKIDDQSFAVTDVQIAIGLRREAGMHGFSRITSALSNILIDKSVDEIFAFSDFSHLGIPLLHKFSLHYNLL